ncbi:hypothetical protein D3C78_725410 [compost metagenome]
MCAIQIVSHHHIDRPLRKLKRLDRRSWLQYNSQKFIRLMKPLVQLGVEHTQLVPILRTNLLIIDLHSIKTIAEHGIHNLIDMPHSTRLGSNQSGYKVGILLHRCSVCTNSVIYDRKADIR